VEKGKKEMKITYEYDDIQMVKEALNEALEGAVHFKDMGRNCPHCMSMAALEILSKGKTKQCSLDHLVEYNEGFYLCPECNQVLKGPDG
jgi:hypothetical protein